MQNNLYNIRNENMKYYFKSKLRHLSKSSNIYKDVTENFLLFTVPNNHNISFAKEIIVNGKTYKLNNQNKFNFRNNEINVAFWLINTIGGKVELRFEIGEERNIISADYNFLSEPLDLKEIKRGASRYSFGHNVIKQAKSFIMDVTNNNNNNLCEFLEPYKKKKCRLKNNENNDFFTRKCCGDLMFQYKFFK